ncbi:phosphomannomutase CpsG [Echinimonas agarilytica]|uniref:phosphomannomutase n=1 Tax=Echinimonas agarilytica TaxID=1215918 RepID=A0AA41WBS9_9GAMM|nr:phosphomannomutase CpsG [Echinimonas agarilytica]MCM2681438.1 phosphomannomutase CpsG [Echinimonas agarilytica]
MAELTCFKAYDIRGQLGTQLNEDIAYDIGRAYGEFLQPETVVVGGDARETSEALKNALAQGLMDAGTHIIDLGLAGTEEIYFATSHLGIDGGVEVTASHNPIDYNGMKLVSKGSRPIGNDSGLLDIKRIAGEAPWREGRLESDRPKGRYQQKDLLVPYVEHLMSYIDTAKLKPLKLVVNAGNGAAGHVVNEIERQFAAANVPLTLIKIFNDPDPTFPNGIPNPLLPENRASTANAVKEHGADMGIAWDGDFDRCFLFDERGEFIEGYYIVGLLAAAFLAQKPGSKIIHDPRLTWNTIDVVNQSGGVPVMSKTGHAFIKDIMREQDAIYGGEMSAHHYFRDFAYCDSGMIPWLLIAELVSVKEASLSSLVEQRIAAYPSSGEINQKLSNPEQSIANVLSHYEKDAELIDRTDGISIEFSQWRFNLRKSNTEPVVRLNVESRADHALMEAKTKELIALLSD